MRGLILPPIETINLPIESNLVCEIPFAKLSFNIKGLLLMCYNSKRNTLYGLFRQTFQKE